MSKLLEVKNLKTYFYTDKGIVKAVDDVTFDMEQGKTLGIVGESGCGKSITAMSILRLIEKPGMILSESSILFEGEEITAMDKNQLHNLRGNHISMIFQEPMTSLNPVFKVGEQISEVLILHQNMDKATARAKAIEMLKLVGIPRAERVIDDYPHQLSGGMRQRVMIAMALACNPKLLIADEPTTALDVTIQAQILTLMNDLKERLNTSIMLITHDLGVIAQMADDVIVMYSGKIVESGPVKEIFENPKHPYTIGLLNSIPSLDSDKDRLYSIEGVVPSPFHLPEGCYFAPRCTQACERCKVECPSLTHVSPGHQVSCFLYEETQEKGEENQ